MWRSACRLVSCLAGCLSLCQPARADDVADFYAGKVINLVIASGEGGYDASLAQNPRK